MTKFASDLESNLGDEFFAGCLIDGYGDEISEIRRGSELDCPWCGSGEPCGHRLAEVRSGRISLTGLPPRTSRHLLGLHRRLVLAVIDDRPKPVECASLLGADGLTAEVEREWDRCGDGFFRDPDVDGWAEILCDRTADIFSDWCFRLLRSLSCGTVDRAESFRLDSDDLNEVWVAAEPGLLADDVEAALSGRGRDFNHDPLLSVRKIPA